MSKRKVRLALFSGWVIIGFLSLMIAPSLPTATDNNQAQFIIASWDYPDEYGQGIESIYLASNGTGSWVSLPGGNPATSSDATTFNLSIGEAVRLIVYVYLNRTHIGLPQPWNNGHDFIRLNVTVETPLATVFSQNNFTYDGFGGTADQVEWYKYSVILNFLTQEATTYTATVTYDIYYEDPFEDFTQVDRIEITGSSGAGTDYQVSLSLTSDAETGYHFEHVRFYDSSNTTLLPAWLESFNMGQAVIWVQVSDNLDTDQVIYMYSGDTSLSAYWDGPATFPFFDDFNDASFNTSLWTEQSSGGSYTESGGYLKVMGPSPERIVADFGFGSSYAFYMVNLTVTAKGANKYLYVGVYNFTTTNMALFQSYSGTDYIRTYDSAYETNAWGDFTSESNFEIRTLSAVKTEFVVNGGIIFTHTTQESAIKKPFDFEVTGAGTGAGDYIQLSAALVRKCIDVEPAVSVAATVTYSGVSEWVLHTTINNLIFPVPISAAALWALNGWYMLLGAGLVIFSTTFGAVKMRDRSGSLETVMIVIMCFLIGWALIIGLVV